MITRKGFGQPQRVLSCVALFVRNKRNYTTSQPPQHRRSSPELRCCHSRRNGLLTGSCSSTEEWSSESKVVLSQASLVFFLVKALEKASLEASSTGTIWLLSIHFLRNCLQGAYIPTSSGWKSTVVPAGKSRRWMFFFANCFAIGGSYRLPWGLASINHHLSLIGLWNCVIHDSPVQSVVIDPNTSFRLL